MIKLVPLIPRAVALPLSVRSPPKIAEAMKGATATNPRKKAPAQVMRNRTLFMYSAVGRPGRIPGMKPPCFCKFSATFCC